MKLLTACFVAGLAVATTAMAQSTAGSTQASVVGTMTVTTTVAPPFIGTDAAKKPKGTRITNEILILRTDAGSVEYGMSVSGIQIVETDGTLDQVTDGEVVTALSAEAVRQGVALGLNTDKTGVWTESQVVRSGTGIETAFEPATETEVKLIYSVTDSNPQLIGTYTEGTSGSGIQ